MYLRLLAVGALALSFAFRAHDQIQSWIPSSRTPFEGRLKLAVPPFVINSIGQPLDVTSSRIALEFGDSPDAVAEFLRTEEAKDKTSLVPGVRVTRTFSFWVHGEALSTLDKAKGVLTIQPTGVVPCFMIDTRTSCDFPSLVVFSRTVSKETIPSKAGLPSYIVRKDLVFGAMLPLPKGNGLAFEMPADALPTELRDSIGILVTLDPRRGDAALLYSGLRSESASDGSAVETSVMTFRIPIHWIHVVNIETGAVLGRLEF